MPYINVDPKLGTRQALDAYEAGIKASSDARAACPYAIGSEEAKEWRLGVRHSHDSSPANKNKRLRRLRLKLAREGGAHTDAEWNALCAEFGFRCVRCGSLPHILERDHIVPIYRRGTDAISNIQPLCGICNTSKGPEDVNWSAFRRQFGFE